MRMSKDQFPMKEKLAAFDMKASSAWAELDADQRKSVTADLWIFNRWMSSVGNMNWKNKTITDTAETFETVILTNEIYNKNWAAVSKHPELQWKLLCSIFETPKLRSHNWIGLKSSKRTSNKDVKLLMKIYPNMKQDEVELLAGLLTTKELKELSDQIEYNSKED